MNPICNVVYVPLSEIKPYERNTQKHTEWHIQEIMTSIKQFGFSVPILLDGNNVIIAGHGRFEASKQLKLKEVPCIIKDDLSPEEVQAFRINENTVSSYLNWDKDTLSKEIESLMNVEVPFELDSLFLNHEEITDILYNRKEEPPTTDIDFFDDVGSRTASEQSDNVPKQDFDSFSSECGESAEEVLHEIKFKLPTKHRELVLQALEKAKILIESDSNNEALYVICNQFKQN